MSIQIDVIYDTDEYEDEEVLKILPDEFSCPSCFLVHHISQRQESGLCSDCD